MAQPRGWLLRGAVLPPVTEGHLTRVAEHARMGEWPGPRSPQIDRNVHEVGAGSDRAYAKNARLYNNAHNAAHRPLASELKHVLSAVGAFVHNM
jgi:hypothetical protein